jgi:transposase
MNRGQSWLAAGFATRRPEEPCATSASTVLWEPGQGQPAPATRHRVRGAFQDGPLKRRRIALSETKKYRAWTVGQKLEIVLTGLRGDRSVAEVCREHQISENLFYAWREKLLEGGSERLSGKEERTELAELRKAGW